MVRAAAIFDEIAERFFIDVLGTPNGEEFTCMAPIDEPVPEAINVYTVGSTRYPTHRFASIGTYAAYHAVDPARPPLPNNHCKLYGT